MKYKALILDIDGTLSPPSSGKTANTPSARVINSIQKAQKKVSVGIATARPLSMIEEIVNEVKLNGYSILQNGAQIIDNSQKTVWQKPLTNKAAVSAYEIIKRFKFPVFASTMTEALEITERESS